MPLDFKFQTDTAAVMRQTEPKYLYMLTDFTSAGVMPDLSDTRSKELNAALTKSSGVDWSKTYAVAKETLAKELASSLKSTDAPQAAQLKVAAQELEFLKQSPANTRESLMRGFRENDQKYRQLRDDALAVCKQINPAGFELGVYRVQDRVIADVDSIDPKPLLIELRSINKLLANESDAKVKAALQQDKSDLLLAMIAPFYERCRSASIQYLDKNYWLEEKYLKSAVDKLPSLPVETWQLESNCKFRDAMTDEYKQLVVLGNLPAAFEANLPKLDLIDHNGAVTHKELEMAEAKHDPALAPLISVLKLDYDVLTSHHTPLMSKEGITDDDVKAFAVKRRDIMPNSASYLHR
jgi:hypothetical protein